MNIAKLKETDLTPELPSEELKKQLAEKQPQAAKPERSPVYLALLQGNFKWIVKRYARQQFDKVMRDLKVLESSKAKDAPIKLIEFMESIVLPTYVEISSLDKPTPEKVLELGRIAFSEFVLRKVKESRNSATGFQGKRSKLIRIEKLGKGKLAKIYLKPDGQEERIES